MKPLLIFTYTVLFVLAITACQDKSSSPQIFFTREDFQTTITLKNPEKVLLEQTPQISNPIGYYLITDSLIVVQNQTGCKSAVDLYALNTGKFLSNLAPLGRGPGEFITLRAIIPSSDIFHATDGRIFYTVQLDTLRKNQKLYFFQQFSYRAPDIHPTVNITPLDDSSYIAYNLWYAEKAEYNPNHLKPLTKYYIGKEKSNPLDKKGYFPGPINGGTILISPDQHIWLADAHTPQVSIYNDNLVLIKTLSGPDHYNIQYSEVETPALTMITFSNNQSYRSYIYATHTRNHVYLIFEGVNGKNTTDFEHQPLSPCEIFKFSLQGEPLCNYKLDKYIYTLSVSPDEKYFYCTSRDSLSGNAHLLRYSL